MTPPSSYTDVSCHVLWWTILDSTRMCVYMCKRSDIARQRARPQSASNAWSVRGLAFDVIMQQTSWRHQVTDTWRAGRPLLFGLPSWRCIRHRLQCTVSSASPRPRPSTHDCRWMRISAGINTMLFQDLVVPRAVRRRRPCYSNVVKQHRRARLATQFNRGANHARHHIVRGLSVDWSKGCAKRKNVRMNKLMK